MRYGLADPCDGRLVSRLRSEARVTMASVIVSIEIDESGSCRSPAGTVPEKRKDRVMTSIVCTGEIFSEGGRYVGLCRELNVSSFGESPEDARESLHEAVATFLEGCDLLGTLRHVLEEAGFEMADGAMRRPANR